jgi:3-dehydroquinate dehydratase/shikimate dehydrogenase
MAQKTQLRSPFGAGVARLCAVVAAPTAREMVRQIHAALHETPTIELRLDWLHSDTERALLFSWLRRQRLRGTFLATCRRRAGGGLYKGDVAGQLVILQRAVVAGCAWCDVEVESLRLLPLPALREFLGSARILVSLHDFARMPPHVSRFVASWRKWGGDAVKIAACARRIADSVRIANLARRQTRVVAVPMGEVGLPARVLTLREGSALAYASVAATTAPGQVSLEEMKHLYRAHRLDLRTTVYGVIGNPVSHSLSPLLHNTGFIVRRINAVYLPFLVRELRDFLSCIQPLGVRGFSVTLPHKRAMLRHLDDCDPLAAKIGAVNTVVVRRHGLLYGLNTDYVGVLRALEQRLRLRGSRVLLFGAGGAARAAAFALASAGAVVSVCARRPAQARALARAVGGEAIPRAALRSEFFDAIVNCTPVGMHPRAGDSPLSPGELHCRIVMDLIYRPRKTRLLQLAERRGIATVSGVEMFLAQGMAQWEIWTERRAPEAAMRRAVLRALRHEALPALSERRPGAR